VCVLTGLAAVIRSGQTVKATLRLALIALLALGALIGDPARARAVDLRDVLTGYTYTSWSRKDGLVGPVWAIAQDANGFLWLGTDGALVRFDGVRFASWEVLGGQALPRLPIRALYVAPDGTLWIGFGAAGGLARIRDRTVTAFVSTSEADSTGPVSSIVEDRAGNILAAAAAGLFQLRGEAFERLGDGDGLPAEGAATMYLDRSGATWVATSDGLFRRPTGHARFELLEASGQSAPPAALSEDPDGRLWTTDLVVGFRPLGNEAAQPRGTEEGRGYRLMHDRDGHLWVATIGQGLWRVQRQPGGLLVERTTLLSALSSDAVRTVFEDRDGNIWAGTTEGVDRLVPHRVTPWTGLGLVNTIDASRDGRIWAGAADALIPFMHGRDGWTVADDRIPIRGATAIRGTAGGPVWVATTTALFRVEGTSARQLPWPPAGHPFSIEALATDAKGEAWVVAQGGEVYRTEAGQLRLVDHIASSGAGRANAAIVDREGRLWIAYADSRVGVLSAPGQFRTFGDGDLWSGPHYDLFEDAAGAIWVSGADGLSRLEGDRFVLAGRVNGMPPGGAYSMVEDQRGQIWLATSAGIIRLERDEFDRVVADPRYGMRFRIYDTSDGLAGYPVTLGDRHAVRAEDGTLWFVTSRGVSVADPRRLRAERPAPLVAIDAVRADDVRVEGLELRPGTSKVEIDFTAAELTSPLKTRFRYRLEGFDVDWVDAGTRRQALYTGLAPREYRFRVAVSQDDGSWSEVEATAAFLLRPQFWQTWWFSAAVALSIAGVTWAAWQIRVRQLRQQFALVLGERVRLSRELHDTLLQSLVGVALEFDAVSKALDTSPVSARERVIKIREQVEEYIRDARRSIWSLRSPSLDTGDLVEALREAAVRATAGHDVPFTLEHSGTARRLSSNVEHQLLRIGQEALLNAARHAQASRIDLRLHYGDEVLTLTIADDGQGFDASRPTIGTDHYGLTTMRERAQQIGGRLTITSTPGTGTTVEAVVPTGAEPREDGQ
jgi:signal transduction histidine kinase/ligand-binding sensor domain-containing protein